MQAKCTAASEGESEDFCFRVLNGGRREAVTLPQLQAALQSLMLWALNLPADVSEHVTLTAEAVDATLIGCSLFIIFEDLTMGVLERGVQSFCHIRSAYPAMMICDALNSTP